MKYLSVCSGIEAASVAWSCLGWEPLAFSEIEAFPRAVLAHHYPDTPLHGDFTVLRDQDWIADADVLVGGTPCFTRGHLVLTSKGYLPIEEIKPGDLVMTHLGRLQPVARVGSKMAEVGELKAVGLPEPLKVTADHPFLSVKWVNQNTKRGNEYAKVEHCGEPEWTAARQMPGRQWCALTAYVPQEVDEIPGRLSNKEAMYLAGMYLGDGHIGNSNGTGKKSLVLSLNGAKLAKLARVIGECGYTVTHERTAVRATFYDTAFCEWLLANFGHLSHMKRLPAWVLSHPNRKQLLQGYLDTDGYKIRSGHGASTTSRALAYGIADLLNAEGFVANVGFVETPDTTIIEGRIVNQRDWYQVRSYNRSVSRKSRVRHGYLCRTVQSYEDAGEDTVYNIEVEGDNSYIVNCVVVHNCQAFSVAGLRKSLDDDRGNLSLEFVRLADAIDTVRSGRGREPGIIVWENVPGVLSVKDNAFGCFLAALAGESTPLVPPRGKWTNAGVVDGPQRRIAWRTLDAQFFGLAQRRRRVFVVASARAGFDPAAVLLEFEGLRRDSPPRREARQVSPGSATGRAGGGGVTEQLSDSLTVGANQTTGFSSPSVVGYSHWDDPNAPHPTLNQSHNTGGVGQSNQELFSQRGAYLVQEPVIMSSGQANAEIRTDGGAPVLTCLHEAPIVTHSLRAEGFDASEDGTGRGTPLVPVSLSERLKGRPPVECNFAEEFGVPIAFSSKDSGNDASVDLSPTLRSLGAYDANGGGQMAVAIPVQEVGKRTGTSTTDPRAGIGIGEDGDPMYTLQAGAQHGVATAIPFDTTQITSPANYSKPKEGDPCHPLAAGAHPPAVAVALRGREGGGVAELGGDIQNALRASQGGGDKPHVLTSMAVRRLTPVECSRLQGFPDDYLLQVTWRGKCPPADGVMYKALGNSMAVPVMRWIGKRIAEALT